MKGKIITGVICGGMGVLAGTVLTTKMTVKLLGSDEIQEVLIKKLTKGFSKFLYGSEPKDNVKKLIFDTRTDGMKVLEKLEETINLYGYASVADLYDIAGLTSKFEDNEYGWTDISSAVVSFINNKGYSLRMPKATKLN